MIEAVEVVRDKEGGYTHPEWEAFSLSLDDMEMIPGYLLQLFEKAHECKVEAVTFESTVDEDCAAWVEYNDAGGGFASWSLYPPRDDAVLLSVHDTENGPVQLWAVPAGESADG